MGAQLGLRWIDGALHVEGELDLATAEGLLTEVERARPSGELVLDLSHLCFIDSEGCRAIARLTGRTNGRVSLVVLRDPRPPVRRVFDLLRLSGRAIRIMDAEQGLHQPPDPQGPVHGSVSGSDGVGGSPFPLTGRCR
ncbi:MAG TPA: STAS domain-containing protein [Actinomycetota bacterium]|jgi:anti-anti-sigma factor|nr:STAS domain-containing protein [Actinomycetota bacterium]